MDWISILLGGLITGAIAKALLREKRYGILLTTFVGLVGGVIGSLVLKGLGYSFDGWFKNFAVGVMGAILFLGALRLLRNND
jgi:uncharacterized membrane protein YeaQ/YmgE (transglycosylase-associated protein family)